MNSSSSEKSTMASKTLSTSRLDMPEQRAVQVDVLPARSGPAGSRRPSSSRPASLPRTATSPEVGWSTPQMHLSRVDLPEPLRPRMPTVSPSRTVRDTLAQGPEVLGCLALAAVDDALLDRVVLAVGQAEPLGDVAHVDREVAHRSELLGEVALEPTEDGEGDQEEARRTGTARRGRGRRTRAMPFVGRTWNVCLTPLTTA